MPVMSATKLAKNDELAVGAGKIALWTACLRAHHYILGLLELTDYPPFYHHDGACRDGDSYIPVKKRHLLLVVRSSTNTWRSLTRW